MSDEPIDLTTVEPFEVLERGDDTDGERMRVVVTLHPFRSGSPTASDLAHRPWIVDGIGEHFHPKQVESFQVLTGELRVWRDGTEHTLTANDEISLPAGIPHRHWNPADRPARVQVEHRPAGRTDALLETLYTLAQAGRTDDRGIPGFWQSMVLQAAYPDHAYGTDRPVVAQKALATLLAPIGRLAGFEAEYTVDQIEALR